MRDVAEMLVGKCRRIIQMILKGKEIRDTPEMVVDINEN